MRDGAMIGLLLLLTGCGGGTADEPTIRVEIHRTGAAASPTTAPLPADVIVFRMKRDECDHLRGEEPTGPARAAFLRYGMERTCTGTDAALRALRQRHANDPATIAALARHVDAIE
ncbi:hypothetical protein ACFQ15_17720 [Sphingomonas hankookensis]|uniref:hypothetical protein n=1 Tax=Sphingomonas hankookensis TaxID=563996 RepID=UPI001F58649A|nr:hypothetical protein [Sphingomonas hankookensis]